MKKYFYNVIAKDGTIMMSKTSDYAYRLIAADKKAHMMGNGNISLERHLAHVETNIPEYVMYRVSCGDKI